MATTPRVPGGQPPRPPSTQPPPDLPNMPGVSDVLSTYLRRFSLWAVANFNNTLTKKSATGALYLTSPTGESVWSVTVDDAGTLTTTRMTPGAGP